VGDPKLILGAPQSIPRNKRVAVSPQKIVKLLPPIPVAQLRVLIGELLPRLVACHPLVIGLHSQDLDQ
jgi:hypothetical protein